MPIQIFNSYIPVLTKPVTLSSISLSLRPWGREVNSVFVGARYGEVFILPDKDSCFSFPYSMSNLSASVQRVELPFLGLTVSRKNLWLRAQSFP